MAKDILEKVFEDLLSGTGAANSAARERTRAAILANPQTDDPGLADIAAHLDAAPDSGGDAALIGILANDPDVLQEVESAQDFVERVRREEEPVPATLLRLVGAAPAAQRVVQLDVTPSRQVSLRRKPVLLWGGAIAAMIIAGVTGYAIRDFVDRATAPVAFVPTGNQEQNTVVVLPPPAGDAANSAAPPVYAAVNPPLPISSHAVGAGDYPPESVRFQEQGTVKVKYLVLKNGTVGNCQVEISSGFARLDDAACVLVRHWLFKPASVKDGSAVDWWLDASVVYQLRDPGLAPPPQPPATALAAPPKNQRPGIKTQNEALIKAISDALAAAKTQNWTVALDKAKKADAIKDDKPAALNPVIHNMIVSYAINARDFATALAQLDKNIAASEGNRLNNLKQALGVAVIAKNVGKVAEYTEQLKLLGQATPAAQSTAPPMAVTSHAVTADDYPPDSIRLQEQGKVAVIYLVKEDGAVGECSVTQSSGIPRLDDAACTIVKGRWKFIPAIRNGQPVEEYLTAQIVFQLK